MTLSRRSILTGIASLPVVGANAAPLGLTINRDVMKLSVDWVRCTDRTTIVQAFILDGAEYFVDVTEHFHTPPTARA